jgi:flagellin-like protein
MGARRRERGVSDVIATILLLALTVTLFGAIFAFVTSFPSPAPQSNNQFQASLFYPSNGTTKYIAGVRIVHLSGPATPGNALIFLKSANQPSLSIFQKSYLVSTQLGASFWNLGQTLNITFPTTTLPLSGGNITVYIVSQSTLLFSVILPGTSFSAAPTVVSTYISPAIPVVGQPFTVYAALSGSYKTNSVYVNLAGVPGASTTPQVMSQNAQGLWTYTLSSGATTNGTYYAFVNATSSTVSGQTAVGTVVITVSNSGGGSPLSAGVVLSVAPPTASAVETVEAIVSYSGTLVNAPLTVSFYANTTSGTNLWTSQGPSGLTITGPSTVTVLSKSTWTIPTTIQSYKVVSSATVTGYGSARGLFSFTFVNAAVTDSPTSGQTASTVTVSGTGFTSSGTVTIQFGSTAIGACTSGSMTVSATGTFSCAFAVPAGYPSSTPTITVTDVASGSQATVGYTVTAPAITLSPTQGPTGTSVTMSGTGFDPGVTITSSISSGATIGACGATVSATGTFSCTVKITSSTAAAYTVTASGSDVGTVPADVASATFTLTTKAITVTCTTSCTGGNVAPGGTITIAGTGFSVSSTVVIYFKDGATNSTVTCTSGSLSTSSTGSFSCVYTVPASAGANTATVSVEDVSTATWKTATITVT